MTKGIIYYTDNSLDEEFAKLFRQRLVNAAPDIPIVSVSQRPIDLGKNICIGEIGKSYYNLWKQVLTALMYSKADVVYIAEHDVLYDSSYFEFEPEDDNCFYYNRNLWFVRTRDGRALSKPNLCFSQCICNKLTLLDNMMQRVKWYENKGGTHPRYGPSEPGRIRKTKLDERKLFGINLDQKWRLERFMSSKPNVDVRHGENYSGTRRFNIKPQGKENKYYADWVYTDAVPGWGKSQGRFNNWLQEVI